jgi:hypothetical protein
MARVIRSYTADTTEHDDATILALWKLKLNTFEIATKMKRPEWQVANRLMHIRQP